MGYPEKRWLDEVVELCFSRNPKVEDTQKGISIKEKNVPKYFYRYMKWNENSIDSIKNRRVYLSGSEKFNDTYDCSFGWSNELIDELFLKNIKIKLHVVLEKMGISDSLIEQSDDAVRIIYEVRILMGKEMPVAEIETEVAKDKEKMVENMNEWLKKHKQTIFVTCFSENPDNELLWSHYADSHAGICIRYSSHPIISDVWPVKYQDELPNISKYINTSMHSKKYSFRDGDDFSIDVPWLYFAIIKAKKWEYEQEWRIAKRHDDNHLIFNPYFYLVPDAIFLGERMSSDSVSCIRALAKESCIPLLSMHSSHDSYEIVASSAPM